MVGQIKVQTSDSFYKTLEMKEQGIDRKEEDKDFLITDVHFGKNQVGEFYRFEDVIIIYISGSRYDFLWDETLYDKLVAIHE